VTCVNGPINDHGPAAACLENMFVPILQREVLDATSTESDRTLCLVPIKCRQHVVSSPFLKIPTSWSARRFYVRGGGGTLIGSYVAHGQDQSKQD
jgi:hypothetical protein